MKKLVLFLICASILNTTHSMEQSANIEQPLDLGYLLETYPNTLVSHLDGQTLSSLIQVSKLFLAHCDAVPTKYLTIPFSDVAKYGSKKLLNHFHEDRDAILIKRLITQSNNWIPESNMGEQIDTHQKSDPINISKIIELSFDKKLEHFLSDQNALCLTQNHKAVRYIVRSVAPCQQWIMYLNVDECKDAVNEVLTQRLDLAERNILDFTQILKFTNTKAHGGILLCSCDGLIEDHFSLTDSSNSPDDLLKQFELITIFLVAAQKNHIPIMYAILNNPITNSWSPQILTTALYFNNGNEIKDVIAAILFERQKANLKNTK